MSVRPALAVFLILTTVALTACAKKDKPAPPPQEVTVSYPLQKQVVDWDDFVGRFEAMDQIDIRPRVSGYLQAIGFKDGEVVKKGQLLFVIDPRPYQALLDQAKAQEDRAQAALTNTQTALSRGQVLLGARAISQEEFDNRQAAERQAAADLGAAQANARNAQLNLGFTRISAPEGGRVSDRRVAVGNLVTADTTVLTTLVSLDPIRFAFDGSEALYLKYQRDNRDGERKSSRDASNPVQIRLQDEADYRWRGRMDFVDNALSTTSGTIRGRAVVRNPGNFLTPGMFGHLRLLGSAPYQALLVPDQALSSDQTKQIVYLVDEKGVVGQREVQTGPLLEGLRVIRSGLRPTDRVVIDGLQRARPGVTVKAVAGKIALKPASPAANGLAAPPPPAASATAADAR